MRHAVTGHFRQISEANVVLKGFGAWTGCGIDGLSGGREAWGIRDFESWGVGLGEIGGGFWRRLVDLGLAGSAWGKL